MNKTNSFSEKSLEKLSQSHPELQRLFKEVVKHFDCIVVCGHRNQAEQNEAFRTGKSKLQWPHGKHNKTPALAVDVAPCINGKIDWNDLGYFKFYAGFVKGIASQLGIKIRWGGDWDNDNNLKDQNFNDLPHFELVTEGDKNDHAE